MRKYNRLLVFVISAILMWSGNAFASGQIGDYVQVGDGYLGTASIRDAEDTLTDGANLPDGAAIKAYGDTNWGAGTQSALTATSPLTLSGAVTVIAAAARTVSVATNSDTSAGVVTSGSGQVSMVWKTDAAGVPDWRADSVGGTPGFNDITSGINTTATMVVNTGGSLSWDGTGVINANQYLGTTLISAAEFGYLDGVSSAIQAQINAKEGTLTDSAGLAAALSDETGSTNGYAVFSNNPLFQNGATGPGSILFQEDTTNGTNTVQLIGPASTADVVQTLQAVTGTIYCSGGTDVIVADGGTGAGTFTDGGILIGATTGAFEVTAVGAAGEILVGVAAANPKWLAAGTAGYFLIANGANDPVWTTQPTLTSLEGLTIANGSILYGTAADTLAVLAPDTGKYLKSNGAGAPTWDTPVGAGDLLADGTVPLTANWDVGAFTITALTFVSDQATGTAPLTVASTTIVTNLNADTVDGESASAFQDAHASLTSIAGLTETNGGILYGTADNTYAWLAAGATTTILVGGGAAAPVWTTATGTGAPVRAGDPAFTGFPTTPAAAPDADYEVANKKYVDDNIGGVVEGDLVAGTGLTGGGNDVLPGADADVTLAVDGVLEDLDTLGAAASDGQFIVATGAGVFAYESGATVRTSLGLGSAALRAAEDTLTDGANLPDGAAIKAYGDANWSGAGSMSTVKEGGSQVGGADIVTLDFLAADFIIAETPDTEINISIDYTNGQEAASGVKGFLNGTDWATFNAKQAAGNYITALTSDVTAAGPGSAVATIANNVVTYAKMQNVSATDKLLGRSTAGAGDPEEIACTAAGRALLDDADAAAQRVTLGVSGSSGWYNADDYGTHGTRAAIAAAMTAAITAGGGTVYIPAGTWPIASALPTITTGLTILGAGSNGGTTLQTTNSDFNVFYINTLNTVNIRDMKITDNGTPTAGAAIKVTYTGAGYNQRSNFSGLLIVAQYDGINFDEAYGWRMDSCYIADCYRYGTWIKNVAEVDNATAVIDKCIFIENYDRQESAIRYESGGGLHLVNSKILGGGALSALGHDYGFHLVLPVGAGTGDLIIANNSFENLKIWHIYVTTVAATGVEVDGYYHDIQITGNQFASWENSAGDGINIYPQGIGGADIIYGVNIVGNNFDNCGVTTTDGTNISIYSNNFTKGAGTNITSAMNNAGATAVYAGFNNFPGYTAANWATGSFEYNQTPGSIQIKNESPGFWLDETGVIGVNAVLDGGDLQIQTRTAGFGAYQQSPFRLKMSDGTFTMSGKGATWYNNMILTGSTGNLVVRGTVTASCGVLTCDYVFDNDYRLLPLSDLREHIDREKQLPGMTVNRGMDSLDLGNGVKELVVKTEEQALYILQLHERLKILEAKLNL